MSPTSDDAALAEPHAASGIPSPILIQLVLINLLWGGSSVAAKSALLSFGPCTLTVVRFIPAGLVLHALTPRQDRRPFAREDRLPLFLVGFIGISVTYAIFNSGLNRTTASEASLIIACEPILIALFACLFLHERLTAKQWGGMLLGLVGIRLIAGFSAGNWIALLGLCCESTTSVLAKRLTERYAGLRVISCVMLIGAVALIPAAVWELSQGRLHVTWQGIAGWAYLVCVCSLLCYGLWYRMMARYPISAMAAIILIQPMMGPFYGWALRGETLKPGSLVGAVFVIVGIALSTLGSKKQHRER